MKKPARPAAANMRVGRRQNVKRTGQPKHCKLKMLLCYESSYGSWGIDARTAELNLAIAEVGRVN